VIVAMSVIGGAQSIYNNIIMVMVTARRHGGHGPCSLDRLTLYHTSLFRAWHFTFGVGVTLPAIFNSIQIENEKQCTEETVHYFTY